MFQGTNELAMGADTVLPPFDNYFDEALYVLIVKL